MFENAQIIFFPTLNVNAYHIYVNFMCLSLFMGWTYVMDITMKNKKHGYKVYWT